MRNRAKCKLCKTIIESVQYADYVVCKCGEIGLDGGGEKFSVYANDFHNILRIDDEGNEITVTVKEGPVPTDTKPPKPNKDELLLLMDEMIKNIENLPPNAMHTYVTHYDLCSALLLISSILRADCKEESCDISSLN